MPKDAIVATGKLLGYVLRHRPDSIGLALDQSGPQPYPCQPGPFHRRRPAIAGGRAARHHVHLSADIVTASRVGARHGFPAVLAVDAARMRADGIVFYLSDNGVWHTAAVKPTYLSQQTPGPRQS